MTTKLCVCGAKISLSLQALSPRANGDEFDGFYFNCSFCHSTLFIPLLSIENTVKEPARAA
jgi:hypothetical protein